ncbi:MAG TPA: YciI family protein [Acidimicrobiia bacterium]|nr:YciI family protein [Acidimicrobiia bacterium]
MSQYLLSVYVTAGAEEPPAEEIEQIYADVDAVNAELMEAGAWVFGGGLHPADTATVVSAQDGETIVTDGPFAETKEQIGGFWIIEAPDLDAALDWARKATVACRGPVEVRPFQDEPPV